MAKDTSKNLRNQIMYQIFPRQYSNTHDFEGIRCDLNRIRDLGVDIIYLMPIFPIGVKNRKGCIGSPYSIYDYRKVNPDYGSLEDFHNLVDDIHAKGMKVIIDVAYNHTSRDSVLLQEHPEWFYRDKEGNFNNRVGEWWDVTDFDYTKDHALWDELIDILCYWVEEGVDGFRLDVAPLVPKKFWKEARSALKKLNKDVILYAESIHPGFVKWIRILGFEAMTDFECYESFDYTYDYDISDEANAYFKGEAKLNLWLDALLKQEGRYPSNFLKSHCLSNHDNPRIASYIDDKDRLINLWALNIFLKGVTFIYAGDEVCAKKCPSLFEIDPVDWSNLGASYLVPVIQKMANIKKYAIVRDGHYDIHLNDLNVAYVEYFTENERLIGIFNPSLIEGNLKLENIQDGTYKNLFNGQNVNVEAGILEVTNEPVIIHLK